MPEKVDQVLANCREIFHSRESVVDSYPAGQKDYDKGWSNRLNKIMQYIEGGDRNIGEIFARLRAFRMMGRWQADERVEFISFGQPATLLGSSGFVYYRHAVAETVIAAARDDTVAVVELGSGNGESTFTIWSEGRLRRPRFYACEFSEAGRRTARILASLDPRLKLDARFFDFRRPSFEGMEVDKGHMVVFSTHSIEQVSEIPDTLIERICALAPEVTVLHFEPVGWQFAPDPSVDFIVKHKERCLKFNYNTNLWTLLKRYEERGSIEITQALPYFFGYTYNPICKIVWKKK